MKTTNTTAILTIIALFFFTATNSQRTYKDNGTSTTYTLASGDSLYIASGTFTGTINTWNSGSKITVAQNANFKPVSFNDNKSALKVYGTAVLPVLTTGSGFDLKNYGNITVTGDAAMNGGAQNWFNNFGATMTFNSTVSINQNSSTLSNDGTITIKSGLNLYATSTISNTNTITVGGDFKTSKGTLNNSGKLYVQGGITLSGPTAATNSCKMIADQNISIDNNRTVVYNSGFMWATNSKSTSTFTNSGTIVNSGTAKIKSVNFINWGTMNGNAWLYFTGSTTNGGTLGVTGTTADSIRVYDVTRTNSAKIFDTQNGTIYPNVKYATFAAPDTSAAAMASCSAVFFSASNMATLPVVWNYFDAKLVNNIPALNWSAQQDPGTVYELQRSYDNASFVTINTTKAETNKSAYEYNDNNADRNATIIYYRVKATEPTAQVKFTAVKAVKPSVNNNKTAQAYPNPFTSQLSVAYNANSNEQVTVRIYNNMGQLNATKIIAATNGRNIVTINEAAKLAKGMYVIEISSGTEIIATQKVVKN